MRQLQVSAIKDGTVIDHIDSKSTFKVASILNIPAESRLILVGMNLSSRQLGKKGIIKIEGKVLNQEEANKIALIAPNATLNIIKNFEVVEKIIIQLPPQINDIICCPNKRCVSHITQSKFVTTKNRQNQICALCHYCEQSFLLDNIQEYKI